MERFEEMRVSSKCAAVEGAYVLGNYMWFTSMYDTKLYKMNTQNMRAEAVCEIPSEYLNREQFQYKVAGGYNDELVLMPLYSEYLLIYNITLNTFKSFKLLKHSITNISGAGECVKFRSSCQKDSKLWIMPQSAHCIIEYDFKTGLVVEHDEWYDGKYFSYKDDAVKYGFGILDDDTIWIPCWYKNIIVEYSIKNKETTYHEIVAGNCSITAIGVTKDNLWIVTNDYRCIAWDKKSRNVINEVRIPDLTKTPFWKVNVYGNRLLLCPGGIDDFYIIDTETMISTKISNNDIEASFISSCKISDDVDLIFSFSNNVYAKYYINNNKISYCVVRVDFGGCESLIYEDEKSLEEFIHELGK